MNDDMNDDDHSSPPFVRALRTLEKDWRMRAMLFAEPPADKTCLAVANALFATAAELRAVLRNHT